MTYQVSSTPTLISADQTSSIKLLNSGSTVYYKATQNVSSSSNDGSLASGSVLTITGPKWVATASGSTSTISTVDVDGFGFEFTQPGAPISNEAISYLASITGMTGALTGTSLNVTGSITGSSGALGTLVLSGAGKSTLSLSDATTTTGLTIGADTNLYRFAADTLKTDDALVVTGGLTSGAQTLTSATLSGTGKTTISLSDTTTTTGLTIGGDTNLYRSAADTLKTDDSLTVTGTLSAGTLSVPSLTTGAISGSTGTFSGLLSPNAGVDVQAALSGPAYLARQVAANRLIANNLVSTDANNAFNILGDGKLQWGAGGASAVDANLYRVAASILKTDSSFACRTLYSAPTENAGVQVGFQMTCLGDAVQRFSVRSDGKMTFGDGTISPDVNLYRSAADTLKTDDALVVTGALTAGTSALTAASATSSSGGTGTNLLSAPLNTISVSVGSSADASGLTANEWSGAIRFLGAGVSFADFGHFPNGGGANQTALGNFRFSLSAGALDPVPDARVGVGHLYVATNTANTGIQFGGDVNLYRSAANVLKTDDQLIATDGITTKVVAGVVSDGSFTATPTSGTLAVDTTNSFLYVRVGSTWKKVAVA